MEASKPPSPIETHALSISCARLEWPDTTWDVRGKINALESKRKFIASLFVFRGTGIQTWRFANIFLVVLVMCRVWR